MKNNVNRVDTSFIIQLTKAQIEALCEYNDAFILYGLDSLNEGMLDRRLGNLSTIFGIASLALEGAEMSVAAQRANLLSALTALANLFNINDKDTVEQALSNGIEEMTNFMENTYHNSWDMVEVRAPMLVFPDQELRFVTGSFELLRVKIGNGWAE